MYTFLLLLVTIIWGSTFFIIKDAVGSIEPNLIVFIRTSIAAIPMALFALKKEGRRFLQKKNVVPGFILGILLAMTYISQTYGLKFTSSGHSAFVTSSGVVFVPVILFVFYKYRFTFPEILSVLMVFTGLFLLTYDFETQINKGDLLTIITAISYAFHVILSGRYVKHSNEFSLISWQFIGAALISGATFLAQGGTLPEFTPKSISSLVYLGLLGTLFCYFISVWVQKFVSSMQVAIVFSLEPVFAAFFGFIVLGEVLNFRESIGALAILSGMMVYQLVKIRQKNKLKKNKVCL